MTRVICDISVSVGGFVTGPNDTRSNPFGDGVDCLHDWLSVSATDEDRAVLAASVEEIGAVVMGRKSFDKNEGDGGWGDLGPFGAVPCFVVTHRVPQDQYPAVFSFVTDGVAGAIEAARTAAVAKSVQLHGASVMQQAMPLGLVDELRLHVVPVLLGSGTRLFGALDGAVELERTKVVVTPAATHLTFRVLAPSDGVGGG